jgi:hypothetical protein
LSQVIRLVTAMVGLVAGAGVVVPAGLPATAQPARIVRDAGGRFAITLPATWSAQSPSGQLALRAAGPKPDRGLQDSVDIVARSLPAGVTSAQACIEEAAWVTEHLAGISVTTWHTGPTSIAGLAAYSRTYAWRAAAGESRWSLQVCLIRGGEGFVLTGTTANAPGLRARAAVLRQIIDSFRFLRDLAGPAPRVRADRNMSASATG